MLKQGLWATPQLPHPAPGPAFARLLSQGTDSRQESQLVSLCPGVQPQGWPHCSSLSWGLNSQADPHPAAFRSGASVPCPPAFRGGQPGHGHQLLPGEGERWGGGLQDTLDSRSRGQDGPAVPVLAAVSLGLHVFLCWSLSSPHSTHPTPTHA